MNSGERNQEIAAELLLLATKEANVTDFLPKALAIVLRLLSVKVASLVTAEAGKWRMLGSVPVDSSRGLPTDLLSSVLDRSIGAIAGEWAAVPFTDDPDNCEVVLVAAEKERGDALLSSLTALTKTLASALNEVRCKEQAARRIDRLEAILRIAGSWNKSGELEPLLVQMAEAATRLLGADRASIFLWDRPNRTLVGRPALGLPNNELRIPDDAGVVGQVVQTGETRRVGSALDEREINRSVDRSTGYQTRTLLCVPLRTSDGEVFGAFEGINKLDGIFTDDDETALQELAVHAARAIEATQEFEQLLSTRQTLVEQAAQRVQLIGESPSIEKLRNTISRLAVTDLSVLVLGENGTGKEVAAQSIHYQSGRRSHPFIAVNCAAIAETLLESELFGHEKGAFTDARETRVGKFELAHGGTLFLDEIGDLSAAGQAKLLRVLEEKIVVRVGGSKPIHTDARVVAATNQDLAAMVRDKRFRQDLYFRLNVVTLQIPPLRDRGDDVLQLADHFLAHFCRQAKRKPAKFSAAARQRLLKHRWPGNVRELRNLTERLAYLASTDVIEAEELGFTSNSQDADSAFGISPDQPLAEATDVFQTAYIKQMITRAGNNMSDAADRLGLHRSNLYRKMRQLGMETRDE
jgi:transcriptional regulator with GAF, ATPase, and Fis domain